MGNPVFLSVLIFSISLSDEVPATIRAMPHFSGAIGDSTLMIAATAAPTTLTPGDEIAFTVLIRQVRNPADVKRLPIETAAFIVENAQTHIGPQSVAFHYRLRPREMSVREIPSLRFDYYMPEAAEDRRLRTKYTDAIPITMKPKPAESAPAFVLPERFQTLLDEEPSRSPHWNATGWKARLWNVLFFASGSVMLYVLYWRWRNPQGVRLARLLRHKAVRRALADVERKPCEAFREYLQDRFDLAPSQITQHDVEHRLRERGIPQSVLVDVESLLHDSDAARFGSGQAENLPRRTREAILRLEDATCS